MTDKERQLREETFEGYRDRHNRNAQETAFLHSLGLIQAIDNGEQKTKTIRERVAEKIAQAFEVADQSLIAAGHKAEGSPTLKLREILLKDLSPFLRKDKSEISMMDLSTIGLTEESKIRSFLQRHGVNLDKPLDLQYALGIFREAVNFYDEEIACATDPVPEGPKIHNKLRKFTSATDIYNVFKTSGGHGIRHLTPQACALLRIAMVIDFMQKDPLISSMKQVQDELKNDVLRHVRKVGNTFLYHSGNPQEKPVPLISAVARIKDRHRVIMKLLHKPSNSTSEVLDHIGYRFVTESASDVLRLIYQMFFDHDSAVLPAMNIRINKTKQSLVDPNVLMNALKDSKKAQQLFAELSEITINHQDVQTESLTGTENTHSSEKYRAIHITVDFPVMINGNMQLFPIEIQFVDKTSQKGNDEVASHPEYVEKQCAVATKRVLGNNLQTNYQNRKKNGHGKKRLKA